MELVHEAVQTGDQLRIRLNVQFCRQLSNQAFLAIVCLAVHDSMLLDASVIDQGLYGSFGLDMVHFPIATDLSYQEHSILLLHLREELVDFLICL